tara:strand:+ start:353 stop:523 length:171 start_codon:yes stop_codon:yes gene_type:complete
MMPDAGHVRVITMHSHSLPEEGITLVCVGIVPTEELVGLPAGHKALSIYKVEEEAA